MIVLECNTSTVILAEAAVRYSANYMLCKISPMYFKFKGVQPATLLSKRLRCKCYPVSFARFLKTPFLQNIYR